MRKYRWQILLTIVGLSLIAGILFLLRQREPEAAGPQPISGGSFIEAEVGTSVRLNPILDYSNQVDRDINALLYSGLLKFDSRAVPQPDLAEGWAISADSTLYTFYIREGAVWHDGTPVSADDVIYTYSKYRDEDYPGPDYLREFWSDISVTKVEDLVVQFDLPEPYAPFLDYLTVGLLPDHLLRGVSAGNLIDHPFNLNPIGTGMFMFDHFLVDEGSLRGVSLVANENYYFDPPFLQRFDFQFYASDDEAVNALAAGEVQGLYGLSPEHLETILANPALNVHTTPVPELHMVLFNLDEPAAGFLGEKAVRQALMLALNRQNMVDEALDGQAIVAKSLFLTGTWAAEDPPSAWLFDPDQANALLDENGWEIPAGTSPGSEEYLRAKEDQTLEFTLLHPDDAVSEEIALMIQDEWAAVGVRIELQAVDPEELLTERLETGEFQAALVIYNFSNTPDPDPYPFWHDAELGTGQNYSSFSDRNISIWLEQARTTPDVIRRAALYKRFLYRFNELLPGLPLFYPVESYAVDTTVQGITIGPLYDPSYRFQEAAEWYLVARSLIPEAVETSADEQAP